jgi:hypothetical protein
MSNVSMHEFKGHRIRTIKDMNGHVWWGLKDVVSALELGDTPTRWYWWLEDVEKDNKSYLASGGRQYLRMVNRSGLNKMLADSPVEEDFKAWANGLFARQTRPPAAMDCLYTPTRIGEAVGGLSAQQVNQLLCRLGMQMPVMDFNRKRYVLTPVGKALGVAQTFRKENNEEGDSVMWRKPIINLLASRLRAEKRNSQHV